MTWVEEFRSSPTGQVLAEVLGAVFDVIGTPVLVYFFLINATYLLLIALAAVEFTRHLRRSPFAGLDDVATSPLTQPVSVLVPAFNEQAGIVSSVRAMLALRYPEHEVVVIDDGSKDETFARLQAAFDLVQVPRVVPHDVPVRKAPTSVHVPADGRTPLVVVRKENSGRSDSLNVGVAVARYPLVAMVDADSILDPDALLVVSKPFTDDPSRVVATGGVIRAVNGCTVVAGRVVDVRLPRNGLARIQVVEYLRAFLLGRTGWSRAGSLILISGAFGLFRRDVLVDVGGLDPDSIGEDFELVMRIHRTMRRRRRDYRVTFVAEPISWTEVPSTRRVLGSQRRRWHRGLWEVLWKYRGMTFNPRYGRIGLVALPYAWVFELAAPVIELVGVVLVPLGLLVGAVDTTYALTLLLVAYAFAVVVSLAAVCVEELSFHRYTRWRDLGGVLTASVWENIGYRQMTAWWRVRGLVQGMTGRKQVWGTMTRTGFGDTADGPRAAP
ncbi:glycosyltransferase family 2 protein [Cellulomonas bogoriensis]|uniref:Glycosyltransferase n=1 Tax=Cellulomonas bogoriensis 69B4 = DSM 16987 TaxID=1386082 RepID=A0A0A0BZ58_9CELL|nr:glycosyltransferase [Cellulomonas bogoriensis]KGM12992.1 glycosyltransferase [Cellulomonas bogoriensis 69B4 = DSM 16987]